MSTKEYFVTKLSFREEEKLIKDVYAYEYDGAELSEGENRQRHWMVNRTLEGSQISIMKPNDKGVWQRGEPFSFTNNLFSWEHQLPQNLSKRKTFVSYYHHDDQLYREKFENLFGDLLISKSVNDGDIDADNSDEYIKQLIQNDCLADTTVLIVLIGSNTKFRKHVDWEISGALSYKVGDKYAGLLGLFLPTHPSYGLQNYIPDSIPKRLYKNHKSGYAILRDWTEDRVKLQEYIELVFAKRDNDKLIVNREIPQMKYNTSE